MTNSSADIMSLRLAVSDDDPGISISTVWRIYVIHLARVRAIFIVMAASTMA